MSLLTSAPQRWPLAEHGSRKFILQRFPFAVFYREQQTALQGAGNRPRTPAARILERSALGSSCLKEETKTQLLELADDLSKNGLSKGTAKIVL